MLREQARSALVYQTNQRHSARERVDVELRHCDSPEPRLHRVDGRSIGEEETQIEGQIFAVDSFHVDEVVQLPRQKRRQFDDDRRHGRVPYGRRGVVQMLDGYGRQARLHQVDSRRLWLGKKSGSSRRLVVVHDEEAEGVVKGMALFVTWRNYSQP